MIQGSFKLSENGHHLLASSLPALPMSSPSIGGNLGRSDHGDLLYAVSPTTGACTVLSADSLQVCACFRAEKCETDGPLTHIFIRRSLAATATATSVATSSALATATLWDHLALTSPRAVFLAKIPVISCQTSSAESPSLRSSSVDVRTRRLDAAVCFPSSASDVALTSAAWEPSAQCLAVGDALGLYLLRVLYSYLIRWSIHLVSFHCCVTCEIVTSDQTVTGAVSIVRLNESSDLHSDSTAPNLSISAFQLHGIGPHRSSSPSVQTLEWLTAASSGPAAEAAATVASALDSTASNLVLLSASLDATVKLTQIALASATSACNGNNFIHRPEFVC